MEGYIRGWLEVRITTYLKIFLLQFAETTGEHDFRARAFWVESIEKASKDSAIQDVIDKSLQALIAEGIVTRKEVREKYQSREFYDDMACKHNSIKKELCERYVRNINSWSL